MTPVAEGAGLHLPMSNRLPVGPGSRGGLWHDRGYRSRWWAAYRRANPQWGIDRRVMRQQERRERAERIAARLPSFTQVCVLVLAEEAAQHGYRKVGKRLAVEHTTVWRAVTERFAPSADLIDATVAAYGLRRIRDKAGAIERQVRSEERARDRGRDPADIVSSTSFPRPFQLPAVCGSCDDGLHDEEASA